MNEKPVQTTTKQKIVLVIFGFVLFLIFLETGLQVGSLALLSGQYSSNKISVDADGYYRILTLGESTTAWGDKDSWSSQLEWILNNNRNSEIKFKVFNEGTSAKTTPFILTKLEDNLDKYKPHMVITMMGINDETYSSMKQGERITLNNPTWLEKFRVYKLTKLLATTWERKAEESNIIKLANIVEINKQFIQEEDRKIKEYMQSGSDYLYQKKFQEGEKMFIKALELDPNNEQIYIKLGSNYLWQIELGKTEGMFIEKAEEMFKKAIEINPNNHNAYKELGYLYRTQGRYEEAEEIYKKVIEIDPNFTMPYYGLAKLYNKIGLFKKAEEMVEKIVKLLPEINNDQFFETWTFYRNQGDIEKAENLIKKAIEIHANKSWPYAEMGIFYIEQNRITEAEVMFKKAMEIRTKNYNSITRENYFKLYQILKERDVKYIAMQYPIRSVDELKIIFKGGEDIIFVSNEDNFKKALQKNKYEYLFIDIFGGEFGHATYEGNKLIAKNAAKAIFKELGYIN